MVVALDDDFWYLRSAVGTFQKRRPWTDEWLTPWAASTSMIVSIVFALTGSFTSAVHLTLAASAGVASAGMMGILSRVGVNRGTALWVAILVLGTPTVMFMFLMFTSVAVYWACLWVCLFAAKSSRWGTFFLFWAVALSGRQSAVVWLALPVIELGSLLVQKERMTEFSVRIKKLGSVLLAGGAIFIL
jgi:hypothetical protein